MSDPKQGSELLDRLDQLSGDIATALGADAPQSVSAALDDDEKAAINNILRFVGAHKLAHTLNRDGEVIVPALDGSTDVMLSPRLLEGEEWVSLYMVVLV